MNDRCFLYPRTGSVLLFLLSVLVPGMLCSPAAHAGRYGPQRFNYPNGTVPGGGAWYDGTTLNSSTIVGFTNLGFTNVVLAMVWSNALVLSSNGVPGVVSSFKIPDLDPVQDIIGFNLSFSLRMKSTSTPGRGLSVSFGSLPEDDGDGELGFSTPGGLVVSFDTFVDAAAGETSGEIAVYVNRSKVAGFPRTFDFDNLSRTNSIGWSTQGLWIVTAGQTVTTNLPVPGLVPRIGDRFAFSARTGETESQDTVIDNVSINTTAAGNILTGGPIISEFVAANTDFEDDELDTPDWIEIYNGGESTNLAGWFLTNEKTNRTKWALPALSVRANTNVLVFASAKNRSSTNASLHANFTLERNGGYLALIRPDLTLASEFEYGTQADDVAFGEVGASRTVGYLDTPTPGRRNVSLVADRPPAEEVRYSRQGGIITGADFTELRILTPRSTNALVRFTTNNSIPTVTSPIYTTPFRTTNGLTVRARVFEPGRLPGSVKSRTLIRIDGTLTNFAGSGQVFSSPLPFLLIESFNVDVDSASRAFQTSYTVAIDNNSESGRATITDAPQFQGRTGIHVRGESSAGFGQKSYALEIWDENNADRDDSMLGLPPESDWVLYGPWSEKTFMRNHLMYQTMREIRSDYSGSRTRFVEVFMTSQRNQPLSYSDYRGVYLLVEKIKYSKNRLDIGKLNPLVTDSNLITGGYVFKKDKPSSGLTAWMTRSNRIELQSQDPEQLTPPQKSYLEKYLNDFEAVLNGPNYADPVNGYAAWIDVGSFVDAQLYVEIAKQVDGYVFSTYFYKPRGGKVFAGPTWDFNFALGNADYGGRNPAREWLYNGNDTDPLVGGLWYGRLQQDPEHKLRFFDRYFELRRGVWGTSNVFYRMDAIVDTLMDGLTFPITNNVPLAFQSPVARHYRKYPILGEYHWPNPPGVESRQTFQSEITYLKNWLGTRLEWIDDQYLDGSSILRPPVLSLEGGGVPAGSMLSIQPHGGPAPPGRVYAGGVVYYTTDGSDPRPLYYPAPGRQTRVLIPEYSPANYFVPTDVNGGATVEFADWTGVTLGATASGLDWKSGRLGLGFAATNSPLYRHVGGGNHAAGDIRDAVLNNSSAVFIRVPFTVTAEDLPRMVALGLKMRFDDGFIVYLNGREATRVHINPDTVPAYTNVAENLLPGWSDSVGALQREINLAQFVEHLRIGENILAIHGVNQSRTNNDLLFSPQLTATIGIPPTTEITSRAYTQPVPITGTTQIKARLYANGMWSPLNEATYVVDAVLASKDNLVISEFMYNPPAPTPEERTVSTSNGDYEWIEFFNSSLSAVDLTGVRITNGIRYDFATASPDAIRLPAGGRVVLSANPAAFLKRYGANPNVRLTGPFADNLSNNGERLTVVGRDGRMIADFQYGDSSPWPQEADGAGASLVLNNPRQLPRPDLSQPWNWHASGIAKGSPGLEDAVPFLLDPLGDNDRDGLANLFEYATGSDPEDAFSRSTLGAAIRAFTVAGISSAYYVFEFRQSLAAGNVSFVVETSSDLVTWSSASGQLVFTGSRNNPDGTATMTYRSGRPMDQIQDPALFVRLLVRSER